MLQSSSSLKDAPQISPKTYTQGMEDLLEIKSLTIDYASVDGRVRPLENVSLRVQKGEMVGIVGESGSGKTTLGLAIIGLLDTPPAEIVNGSIIFEGRDLLKLNQSELTAIRGTGIGMVFQESLVSLNPVYKTEAQLKESLKVLGRARKLKLTSEKEHGMMIDVLRSLHLDKPEAVVKKYPHELSGGMRQRISIAMAMVEEPRLLILDEVTTGLDVYVQNRMLALLRGLNRKLGVTMILITHDLTVAAQICDRLYVMYAGRLMEVGEADDVLSTPLHPYTQGLTAAVPQGFADSPPLPVTVGEPPDLRNLPKGCKFYPRCPYAMEICEEKEPPLLEAGNERYVSCWLRGKI